MKILKRNPDIFFKDYGDIMKLIRLDDEEDNLYELDGIACWIVQEALSEPASREEILEFVREDFEEIPADSEKKINDLINELIENAIIIEEDA